MSPPPEEKSALLAAANQVESPYRDLRRNVEINIGKVCNNKCVFCLDGMPSKEDHRFIDFQVMKGELERFRAEGHLSVGFLGGEPTTYPKIVESVAYAKELGFTRIALATNAMMLRREPFLDKLVNAGLSRVTISMHGHTKALEDKLVDVPGAYEKKITAIQHLLARREKGLLADGVSVNIVLNAWNGPHLLPHDAFLLRQDGAGRSARELRAPRGVRRGQRRSRADLHGHGEAAHEGDPPQRVTLQEDLHVRRLSALRPARGAAAHQAPLREVLRRRLPSATSPRIARSAPRGPMGSRPSEGGRSRFNWQDRKRYDLKHHMDSCQRCAMTDVCEGVWNGYLDIYGDREFAPLVWEGDQATRNVPAPERGAHAPQGGQAREAPRAPDRPAAPD